MRSLTVMALSGICVGKTELEKNCTKPRMADLWELFKGLWNLSDDDSLLTDASTANDSVVEDAILRFQTLVKEITDRLAYLSAQRASEVDELQLYKEAVILAYTAALNNDVSGVKKALEKLVSA